MSAPARLPLSERLNRLVTAIAITMSPPPAVVIAPPLWGDSNVSFVIDEEEEEDNDKGFVSVLPMFASFKVSSFSSSTSISASFSGGSMSSVLDALEANFQCALLRGLEYFGAVEEEGDFHEGSRFES
ncbi:hypothetical protein R3P38DRAFT_427202 [Favolaschia claudopus]|uniref:Uncharacterized protein n=1 Tax=Favolaschia claudopus TaxID=2862362 RepID=A0AAW0CQV1_9AGAR